MERRKFPRIEKDILLILNRKEQDYGIIRNISKGGFSFETNKNISQEDSFDVKICLPLESRNTFVDIDCKVRVVWYQRLSDFFEESSRCRYRAGARFTEINKKDIDIIEEINNG